MIKLLASKALGGWWDVDFDIAQGAVDAQPFA